MPNMINSTAYHSLVVVIDKLFVIARRTNNCEVYDSTCKHFVALEPLINIVYAINSIKVGSKIFVFSNPSPSSFFCYDVDTNTWSEEPCEVTADLKWYSILNVPSF